jgi:hypothetical protein
VRTGTDPISARLAGWEGFDVGHDADSTSEGRGTFGSAKLRDELTELRKAISDDIWVCTQFLQAGERNNYGPTGTETWYYSTLALDAYTLTSENNGFCAVGSITPRVAWPLPQAPIPDPLPVWGPPPPTYPVAPGAMYSVDFIRDVTINSPDSQTLKVGHETHARAQASCGPGATIDEGYTRQFVWYGFCDIYLPEIHWPTGNGGAGLAAANYSINFWYNLYDTFNSDLGLIPRERWTDLRIYVLDADVNLKWSPSSYPAPQTEITARANTLINTSRTLLTTIPAATFIAAPGGFLSPAWIHHTFTTSALGYNAAYSSNKRTLFFIDNVSEDGLGGVYGPHSDHTVYHGIGVGNPPRYATDNQFYLLIRGVYTTIPASTPSSCYSRCSSLAIKYQDAGAL